jgi:hypothetical protein
MDNERVVRKLLACGGYDAPGGDEKKSEEPDE